MEVKDVYALTASHSEPVSNEKPVMQEANKASLQDQDHDDNDIEVLPQRLSMKNPNQAFTYLVKFLNTVEEFNPNRKEVQWSVEMLKELHLATDFFTKKRRHVFYFLL